MVMQTHHQVESVLDEWEALADRVNSMPFVRSGWIMAWCKYFAAGSLEVLSIRRDDRVVGLVPLCRRFGMLRSPTNHHTPAFGLLAEDQSAALYLVQALFSQAHDQISLAYLDTENGDVAAFLATARDARERVIVRTQDHSLFIPLKGADWSTLESRLGAKLRGDLRRRWRRLEQAGHPSFEIADGSENLSKLLDEGFGVEPSGWKERRGTAINSSLRTLSFYREIARWAASRGTLRLAFLRLDGRALAFQFGLEEDRTYYFLKGGYDPAFRQYAPGKLLVRELLRCASEAGLKNFQFLGKEEEWKREWTSAYRSRVTVSAFRPSLLGYVELIAQEYGRPVIKSILTPYRSSMRWIRHK